MQCKSRFSLFLLSMLLPALLLGVPGVMAQQRPERPTSPVAPPPVTDPPSANKDLEVKVWTDKGDQEPTYFVGERIYISFTVTKDSYLVLYDIDSNGNVNILFPNPYHPDNLVRKGRIYTLPSVSLKRDFIVKGPVGEEFFFAAASVYPYYHWNLNGPRPLHLYPHSDMLVQYNIGDHVRRNSYPGNAVGRNFLEIKIAKNVTDEIELHYNNQAGKFYPLTYTRCKFYVKMPPY